MLNDTSSFIRLTGFKSDPIAVKLLPEDIARKYQIVPLRFENNQLIIACARPKNKLPIREISQATKRAIHPLQAGYPEIRATLDLIYGHKTIAPPKLELHETLYYLGHIKQLDIGDTDNLQDHIKEYSKQFLSESEISQETNITEAIAFRYNLPHLRLRGLNPVSELAMLVPWEIARDMRIIPLWWLDSMLLVATPKFEDIPNSQELSEIIGLPTQLVICPESEWERLYRLYYLRGIAQEADGLDAAINLVNQSVISQSELKAVVAISKQNGLSISENLIRNNLITIQEWQSAQSQATNIQVEDTPETFDYACLSSKDIACIIPGKIAKQFSITALDIVDSTLILGMCSPNSNVIRMIEHITGLKVSPRLISKDICDHINKNIDDINCQQNIPTLPRLGKFLLCLGIITPSQLDDALLKDILSTKPLGEQLIQLGYLDDTDLAEILSLQTGLPYTRLEHARIDRALISALPQKILTEHLLLPIISRGNDIWIAIADPFDLDGVIAIEETFGKRVWPVITPLSAILSAHDRLIGNKSKTISPKVLAIINQLVERSYLTQSQASSALAKYSMYGTQLDVAIANESDYSELDITLALAKIISIPVIDLQLIEEKLQSVGPLGHLVEKIKTTDLIDEQIANLIDKETAKRLSIIPVKQLGHKLIVAFSDPVYEPALAQIETVLKREIIPMFALRSELNDAIQRNLGRRNIGTYLLLEGLLTRSQLNESLEVATRTGVRLGQAMVNRKFITQAQLSRALAEQSSLPYVDMSEIKIDESLARRVDPKTARRLGILPIAGDQNHIILAMVDPLNNEGLVFAQGIFERNIDPILITDRDMDLMLEQVYSDDYLAYSISALIDREPGDSAYWVLNTNQKISLLLFFIITFIWLLIDIPSYIIIFNAVSTLFYLAFSFYKFYLVYRALSRHLEIPVTDEEISEVADRDLPIYSILIPVYKESEVLVDLLNALDRLDYPSTKLDIIVLMEEDDQETIDAFYRWDPPSHFRGIVVPYGEPKTKPKACNYGLIHSRGEYIVIFDAEDLPDPDQLKKIVVAFSKTPNNVVCIQAKLNYYNSHQNLLTRWFTVEYSMWFDLFLPGLDASNAPIPLGGTSNHFRRDSLIEVGAWDPYNVTEDADLGIRLYKRGYKTAIVDSTTYEEANSQIYNWIRQRSRWIKGYMQTWLVHTRNPIELLKEIGPKAFLSFQFVVGGTFFAALMNPIYWVLTTLWFLTEWEFIQVIFPPIVYFLGAICLFIGNFAFTYMNVAGALRRGYFDMVKYALLSPLYWGLASVGAWKGFIQLITQPHYWEKTKHGLTEDKPKHEDIDPENDAESN